MTSLSEPTYGNRGELRDDGVQEQEANAENHTLNTKGHFVLPSLATALRFLGGLLVVASGLLFMLQGLADANITIRYWMYLALMFVLSVGGFFSYRLMQDDKGARLFFTLATVLVPVQFSQVAAMLNDFASHPNTVMDLPMSFIQLLVLTILTILVGSLSSYSGFSVLARKYSKQLTLSFLSFNFLLLLPMRDFASVVIISGLILLVYRWLDSKIFRTEQLFSTLEGEAVKGLLLMPLAITLVRSGFHFSTDLGVYTLIFEVALLGAYINSKYFVNSRMEDALKLACFTLNCWAALGVVTELFTGLNAVLSISEDFITFFYLCPLIVLSLLAASKGTGQLLYRALASMVYVLMCFWVLVLANLSANLILLLLSVTLVMHALGVRSKSLIICSFWGAISCLGKILFESIHGIDVNAWLVLALAGVVLVGLSSIAERYSRPAIEWFFSGYTQFKDWDV